MGSCITGIRIFLLLILGIRGHGDSNFLLFSDVIRGSCSLDHPVGLGLFILIFLDVGLFKRSLRMKKNGLMCLWVDVPCCYHSTIPFCVLFSLLYFTISFVDLIPHIRAVGMRVEGGRKLVWNRLSKIEDVQSSINHTSPRSNGSSQSETRLSLRDSFFLRVHVQEKWLFNVVESGRRPPGMRKKWGRVSLL